MDDQATVDRLAQLAKPRLMDLLKLKVEHIYDPTPGNENSTVVVEGAVKGAAEGCEIRLTLLRTAQPYKDIDRFVVDDKVIGYIVNPGVLPIAKAISLDIRGRRQLVTRKLESREAGHNAIAHMDGFGVRIMMFFDPVAGETQIVWECLYGVS